MSQAQIEPSRLRRIRLSQDASGMAADFFWGGVGIYGRGSSFGLTRQIYAGSVSSFSPKIMR